MPHSGGRPRIIDECNKLFCALMYCGHFGTPRCHLKAPLHTQAPPHAELPSVLPVLARCDVPLTQRAKPAAARILGDIGQAFMRSSKGRMRSARRA